MDDFDLDLMDYFGENFNSLNEIISDWDDTEMNPTEFDASTMSNLITADTDVVHVVSSVDYVEVDAANLDQKYSGSQNELSSKFKNTDIDSVNDTNPMNDSKIDFGTDKLWRLHLLRTPKLLADAFNTGDIDTIRAIVESTCIADCVLDTSALPTGGVKGRNHIVDLFEALMYVLPDTLMVTRPAKIRNGVITSKFIFSATVSQPISHPKDYLFDTSKYGSKYADDSKESNMLISQMIVDCGAAQIDCKAVMALTLDPSHTSIVSFATRKRGPVNVFPVESQLQKAVDGMIASRHLLKVLKSQLEPGEIPPSDDEEEDYGRAYDAQEVFLRGSMPGGIVVTDKSASLLPTAFVSARLPSDTGAVQEAVQQKVCDQEQSSQPPKNQEAVFGAAVAGVSGVAPTLSGSRGVSQQLFDNRKYSRRLEREALAADSTKIKLRKHERERMSQIRLSAIEDTPIPALLNSM